MFSLVLLSLVDDQLLGWDISSSRIGACEIVGVASDAVVTLSSAAYTDLDWQNTGKQEM